jgi:spore maturation protein CgeB
MQKQGVSRTTNTMMTTNPHNIIVMCIPKIDAYISTEYIISWFGRKNIGTVQKLIELPHKKNPANKRIIIHVSLNDSSENAKIIKERFSQKQDVKLVHNLPWDFWKIVEANNIVYPTSNKHSK